MYHLRLNRAFTLVELMIVVAIIGLLASLILPSFAKARQDAITQKCIQNQRLVYGASQRYEMDTNRTLYSIRTQGVTVRNTLVAAGYILPEGAFDCPSSSLKDNDDYNLLYANQDLTNTTCTINTPLHVYR